MFRELLRKNKQISNKECVEILTNEKRGVFTVNGDEGYPYSMPMNHYYNEEDGCIYFHCGRKGHRLDSLSRSDKVCFCVCEQGKQVQGGWALVVRSVIVFGKAEIIDDIETVKDISARLSRKFTFDSSYIENEIEKYGKATLILKLTPKHISGKRVTES